jgi:hypothetical protein
MRRLIVLGLPHEIVTFPSRHLTPSGVLGWPSGKDVGYVMAAFNGPLTV